MQYGGVAANDKRKAPETLDAVSNPHWQLLMQVPGTFLGKMREVRARVGQAVPGLQEPSTKQGGWNLTRRWLPS